MATLQTMAGVCQELQAVEEGIRECLLAEVGKNPENRKAEAAPGGKLYAHKTQRRRFTEPGHKATVSFN